jgi:hypothetical protein
MVQELQKKRAPKKTKISDMTISQLLTRKDQLLDELTSIMVELNKASMAIEDIGKVIKLSTPLVVPNSYDDIYKSPQLPTATPGMEYAVRVMDPTEQGDSIEALRANIDNLIQG